MGRRSCHVGGGLDRRADADIGHAAAQITRHGSVDIGIIGLGLAFNSAAACMIWPQRRR
jgi:hypothetical protein